MAIAAVLCALGLRFESTHAIIESAFVERKTQSGLAKIRKLKTDKSAAVDLAIKLELNGRDPAGYGLKNLILPGVNKRLAESGIASVLPDYVYRRLIKLAKAKK